MNERRRPSAVPHRRYPSLSDTGQPWFSRRRKRRATAGARTTRDVSFNSVPPTFTRVRVVAWLLIVAFILILVLRG